MNETNKIYQHIIDDLSQSISASDKLELNLWLEESAENQEEYNNVKDIWEEEETALVDDKAWNAFNSKRNQANKEVRSLWIRAALVASVIILLASGWMTRIFSTTELTLATNDQSFLKDTLEDGSQIFLYPSSTFVWNKSNNNVQLNGEAFFIIPPNQGNNYTINLGSAIILVKGTSFRVNAIEDGDNISVRVESGSVELISKENRNDKLLVSAGEEGFYSNKDNALWKGHKKESIYLIYKPNL